MASENDIEKKTPPWTTYSNVSKSGQHLEVIKQEANLVFNYINTTQMRKNF